MAWRRVPTGQRRFAISPGRNQGEEEEGRGAKKARKKKHKMSETAGGGTARKRA